MELQYNCQPETPRREQCGGVCTQPYRPWAALHVKLTKPEPQVLRPLDLEFTMKPEASAKLQAHKYYAWTQVLSPLRLGVYYETWRLSRTPSLQY